jgi:two-component system sensor histidine kinase KdpD
MKHFTRNGVRTLVRFCGSILIVIAITVFYAVIFVRVNSTTIALTYLLGTLAIATGWGLIEAVVTSIVAMLCFNFFFLEPVGTLTISDPQNWIALFAFLVTAIVTSELSASAKNRALEATRRRQEMERLYELSRSLMLLDKESATGAQIAARIAQTFDIPSVALFDRTRDQVFRNGIDSHSISDNKFRDVAIQATPFHDESRNLAVLPIALGGESVGALAISSTSISDTALQAICNLAGIALEKSRMEEASHRMEAARQNEAMKAMLLDALAHEFKTPLTSIKAAASSILEEPSEAQKELRTIIEEEADRLNALVNETMHMARIEAGDLKLQIRAQNVPDLITSVLAQVKVLADERQIKVDVPNDLPQVLADAELAGLTIRQLLTNALKYSDPESPIEVRASHEGAFVRISVKDKGPGIPVRERQRVFERYYRMPENAGRVPGTGLGLHIARNIVEAHGGKIGLRSEPGQGCDFSFTLPAVTNETDLLTAQRNDGTAHYEKEPSDKH